jgi:hypothetical protein
VLELAHLDHFREAVDALHERVFDRPAEAARERHELRRVERLVAEEDDLMLEEGGANVVFGEGLRKVDAEDLGPEGAGKPADFYCSALMFCALMIEA